MITTTYNNSHWFGVEVDSGSGSEGQRLKSNMQLWEKYFVCRLYILNGSLDLDYD